MNTHLIKCCSNLTPIILATLLVITFPPDLNGQGLGQPLNTNGSFENTEPGLITDLINGIEGWILELLGEAQATFEVIEDSTAPHGNHVLKVTPTTFGPNQWSIQAVADSIPVEPGGRYRLSVWAKSEAPGAEINITVGNYAFQEYGAIRPAVLSQQGWQEFILDFTITDNQQIIRAPIHFNYPTPNTNKVIYIDNLRIVNLDHLELMRLPIIVEAESGEIGEAFEVIEENGVTYVTITNDGWDISDPSDPQWSAIWSKPLSENHVITYQVTFPAAGEYNLFVRARVGPQGPDDDSFFYPNGFGEKDVEDADDWKIANQLNVGGYTDPADFVVGRGGAGTGVWKWLNISEGNFHTDGITFIVEEDELTKTFQIGGRETGFHIDKFAFGRAELYYTVERLDSVLPGLTEMEQIFIYHGPPLATGHSKYLGNIYSTAQVPAEPPLFQSYWNQVTPENAGKWGSVAGGGSTPDPATWNWSELDAAYALAKDNGWPFRFHVLVWGSQQPHWIGGLSQEEQLNAIEAWFRAVAERYPDIDHLEVVNEPIPDPPPYREALGGAGETGWDWVIKAFEMAREIFPPTTRLMINDYGILSGGAKMQTYLTIINLLRERNLIDAIGVQGHYFTVQNLPTHTLINSLNTLAATGLPIVVTELDLAGNPAALPTVTPEQSDATQLAAYQNVFPVLWTHPAVEGITLWGWRLGGWRPEREMHLVRANGSERPALTWLRQYMDTVTVSVGDIVEVPSEFRLYNNYPNPFNPSTQIRYRIPESAHVTLKVYDVLGRLIRTIVDEWQSPGEYTVPFHADNLSSGVYIYRLQAGTFTEVKRMTLVR